VLAPGLAGRQVEHAILIYDVVEPLQDPFALDIGQTRRIGDVKEQLDPGF
jgi:hypothetical protein